LRLGNKRNNLIFLKDKKMYNFSMIKLWFLNMFAFLFLIYTFMIVDFLLSYACLFIKKALNKFPERNYYKILPEKKRFVKNKRIEYLRINFNNHYNLLIRTIKNVFLVFYLVLLKYLILLKPYLFCHILDFAFLNKTFSLNNNKYYNYERN
jgi:hypothetical protein